MARIRKNVWKLAPTDDTLLWYGRAVNAMKAKPIADPTSWRYQGAMHESPAFAGDPDPLAQPGDVMPSSADQATFWNQCQHGSWYFLPWHRMYLHFFEQIVAAQVVTLGGPADWALPYWNYSADVPSRLLPTAFRNPTLADGSPNGLFVAQREAAANAGSQFAHSRDVDLTGCLPQGLFKSSSSGGSLGFGGPQTKFEHGGGSTGAVEASPHGSMHVAVGGAGGWMSAFDTAALDPIFWLHHANIDRLWEVWLKRSTAHKNPKTKNWLRSVAFKFHDATGAVISMTPDQVVDTTTAPLSYIYDDVIDPLAGAPIAAAIAGLTTMATTTPTPNPAEMVGATSKEFTIGSGTTYTVVPVKAAPAALAAMAPSIAAGAAPARRTLLNIENLTSDKPAPAYDVFVNVPEGDDPNDHEELHAGRIAMFGLRESSRSDDKHAGSGLHYVLDVTDLVGKLSSKPGWDPSKLRVSFVAARDYPGAEVKVGRVSLFVE